MRALKRSLRIFLIVGLVGAVAGAAVVLIRRRRDTGSVGSEWPDVPAKPEA